MRVSPKAKESLDTVIEKFQSGDLSPITKVARIKLDDSAPAQYWSLSNKVLAFVQTEELDCRGFRQWQKVGRKVKKGSKAAYIVRPHTIKKKEEEDDEETVVVGFSPVPVFAASSTEGEAIPAYTPLKLPPLIEVAKEYGIDVEYVPVASDRLGDCTKEGDRIRLGSSDSRIFFHELAHAMHAKIDGSLKSGQQVDQETVAEFTAAVLMEFYGLGDHTGNAWEYINHYAEDPLLAITKAISTVEKVLAILTKN